MATSAPLDAPHADGLAFVKEHGALEGALTRPFADRRALLSAAQADDASLRARRARLVELLAGSEGTLFREAFVEAFERTRKAAPAPEPATALQEEAAVPAPPLVVAPPLAPPPILTPTFMQVGPPPAAPPRLAAPPPVAPVPAPAPPPDETAFLRFVPAEPTLPFAPGDAKAFIAAALASKEEATTDTAATGEEATTAASGDETQALDLRKLREEVHPFEREVERSLPAFVDLLVALTESSGREDEIGARFGVPTAVEREQVLAAWRKRWDAEPAVRAEWQRLYAERARR